ncbi:MAG TPA: hypothetical protein VJP78_03910 [Thermoleophilia bacterium]|nr:hypothetical protein [Thermoleophilia bacterium]
MCSELATIDLQTGSSGMDVSASGAWSESFVKRPETPWMTGRLVHVAGMLLAIAVSPATAVPDYWFFERRRRDASTVAWILEEVIGRPISRAEALRIASQILERAERERMELADWEGNRGIQWGVGE